MNRYIADDIKNKLQACATKEFTIQNFDKLSKCVFLNLAGDENNLKAVDQLAGNEGVYELFNLILLFTIESMKKGLVQSEITSQLIDVGFPQQIVDQYINKYTQFQNFIQDPENNLIAANFESKINFKQLVDLDWQQEIIVSSKYANKVYQEIYKIQLHLKSNGKDETVAFKATLPQLIEINNKLGVIVKNVESYDHKNLK